jgi:hypothetical protein
LANNLRTIQFTIGSQTLCYYRSGGVIVGGLVACSSITSSNWQNENTLLTLPTLTWEMACGLTAYSVSSTNQNGSCTNNGSGSAAITSIAGYGPRFPVKITSLISKTLAEKIEIIWTVDEEKFFSKYEIQKSIDGIGFETIGIENDLGKKLYSFTDVGPKIGNNYYRLKLVDQDGTLDYSKIIAENYLSKKAVSIFPNPVINNKVEVFGKYIPQDLAITDISGKKINFKKVASGEKTILELAGNQAGKILIVSGTIENFHYSEKIFVK